MWFMRVVISAGGTGGHIYPALAIINKIKEKELEDTKKDNKIMKCVSVISAVIAFLSLIATILVSAL